MKILKYKKGTKGRYKIYLDNDSILTLYEEVILKYNLLLSKEIDEDTLIELDKYNQEYDVYYVALDSISRRFKSTYELKELLKRKEYPEDLIDIAIDKLTKQGYLNDKSFTKSYINTAIMTSNKGPRKIERELIDKKIDKNIIYEEIVVFTEDIQKEKINKLINKGIKANNSRGGIVLKQKIFNDIKNLGYDIDIINLVISDYNFGNDKELAKREYDKLYRKYSKKYSGSELEYKIKEKLFQKGLKYEED